MTHSDKPYEFIKWDAEKQPEQGLLERMLRREGYEPKAHQLDAGFRSEEQRFQRTSTRVVVAGVLQVTCPGYGVHELHPGDQLTLDANLTHDLTVLSSSPVSFLFAELKA